MDEPDRAAQVTALWDKALVGPIGNNWHWLTHNFTPGTDGSHYFTPLTLDALIQAGEAMPGYAESMLARLEQTHGRNRDMQDYNAILTRWRRTRTVSHFVKSGSMRSAPGTSRPSARLVPSTTRAR